MNGGEQAIMNGVQPAIVLLAGTIFVSLIIERLLEILKSCFDYLEAKRDWHRFWNSSAEKIQQRAEEFFNNREANIGTARLGFERLKVAEAAYKNNFTISVAALRSYTVKYVAKALGILLGVVIAMLAEIDLFHVIDISIYGSNAEPSEFPRLAQFATGIAMGLGSGPVHKIIAALEKAKKRRTQAN